MKLLNFSQIIYAGNIEAWQCTAQYIQPFTVPRHAYGLKLLLREVSISMDVFFATLAFTLRKDSGHRRSHLISYEIL